jgi:hypothetical protein
MPAVALCPRCYAGLCDEHVAATAREGGPGGMEFRCNHDTWEVRADPAR